MKHLMKPSFFKYAYMLCILTFMHAMAWAQDSTATSTTSTTTTTTQTWYMEPWVWVVGGVILILLIVALTRGGSSGTRTDKVTYTKTTSSETD